MADAREAARSAKTLDELRAILETYDGVGLRRTATRFVFADGNPDARVMFVGEAPGKDEDREGRPFVGRAGTIARPDAGHAIGLDRKTAYIANVIPWRPPGNRTPTPQETQLCLPFIQRQIELANPDILVLLGGSAAAALTGVEGRHPAGCAAAGWTTTPARARLRRSRLCTRPICSAAHRRRSSPGATFAR